MTIRIYSGSPRPSNGLRLRTPILAGLVAVLSVGSAWAEPKFPPSTAGEATSSVNDPVAPVPPAVAPVAVPEAPLPPPVSMRRVAQRVAAAVLAVGLLLAGGVMGYRRLVERAGRPRSARGRMRARPGWWPFFTPDTPLEADRIHLASRRSLGPRESLAVVRVGRERFLVGITGASISLLSRLGEAGRDAGGAEPEAADFAVELDAATTEPRRAYFRPTEPGRVSLRPPTAEGDPADPVTVDSAVRSRIARSRDRLARLGRLTAVAQGSHD